MRIITIAIISFLMLVIASQTASAQRFTAQLFVEQNIMGNQKGIQIGTSLFHYARVAYFYQASHKVSFEKDSNNYAFTGLNISIPIKRCEDISFWAGMKTGIVNDQFLIATPQLTTQIALVKHVNLLINTAYRAGHPAVGTALSLNF